MSEKAIPPEYHDCLRVYLHQLDLTHDSLLSEDYSEAAERLVRLKNDFVKGRYEFKIKDLKGIGIIDIVSELSQFEEDVIRTPKIARKNIGTKLLELNQMIGESEEG